MFGLADHEKFTYEHYLLLPEGDRRELIEGELLMTPAPTEKHQRVSFNIGFQLGMFLEANPVGAIYLAPFDVIFDDYNVVQPDIVVILNEHRARLQNEGLRGAPDLAVEILSPSTATRDTIYKRVLFHRFGVREYWIVDPTAETVECFTRGAVGFVGGAVEKIHSGLLPGFEMELDRVFR